MFKIIAFFVLHFIFFARILEVFVVFSAVYYSNNNDTETKANDNGVFLYISEVNTFDSKQIIFEAKRTHSIEQKLFSKRSEGVQ
jgi:hypothetical protein